MKNLDPTKEKINQAFKSLRKQGLLARQSFMCCSNCAINACQNIIDKDPDKYKGIVYYHKQDLDSYKRTGWVYLRFGYYNPKDRSTENQVEHIGHTVKEACEQAGLTVQWNGDPEIAIKVG